ncbi:MAG: alkaline phosphatase PhoX [Actinomycetota bacterium]
MKRRDFLASGLVALGAAALGPGVWRQALGAEAQPGRSPYGKLQEPDANGLMLPRGFTSRVIAIAGVPVVGTTYLWHTFPDGGATFRTKDGGWIYTSNSEVPQGLGGAGAVRFDRDGEIVGAYPILTGTSSNCAGGPTPWGTWLSCEEFNGGRVWECDPFGGKVPVVHDAMGVFSHESAAVDPVRKRVYLTEDQPDGRFYRFTPKRYPNLSRGRLEVAEVLSGGRTVWHGVPDPSATSKPMRNQVPKAKRFNGGEGTWFDDGIVYFTTKNDDRVWTYDTRNARMSILYDGLALVNPPLLGVDNVVVAKASGDLFVAEDGDDLDIVMITQDRVVARFLKLTGLQHTASEIAGPALDPSGHRLYFSSQRGYGRGVTFEVTGPFRITGRRR